MIKILVPCFITSKWKNNERQLIHQSVLDTEGFGYDWL